VKLWDTKKWECYRSKPLVKKVTAVALTNDGSTVVGSDKFGDVCSFSAARGADDEEPAFLCGHMSLVTCMLLTPDNDRVITADRDEHIRVSHFPDAYDIDMVCLGHKTFVTALLLHPTIAGVLISGDGNGELRAWRYAEGHETSCVKVPTGESEDAAAKAAVLSLAACPKTGLVVVVCEGVATAFCFTVSAEGVLEHSRSIETTRAATGVCVDNDGVLWVASTAIRTSDGAIAPHLEVFSNISGDCKALPEHPVGTVVNAGLTAEAVGGSVWTDGVTKGICHKGVNVKRVRRHGDPGAPEAEQASAE